MKIFISYSSEDRKIADALAIGLRQERHQVFFDRDNLPPGDAYHARIRESISAADLFIFLITPASVRSSSYAQTELELAKQRWPDPSGHVLPVLAAPTPAADVPPYLGAVTHVQGGGNVVASTLGRVAALRRKRSRLRRIGAATAAILVLVSLTWFSLEPLQPQPCYLRATVKTGSATARPDGLLLDVYHDGTMNSFIVSSDGTTNIHVGPLTRAQSTWDFELRSPDGFSSSRPSVDGCPQGAVTYVIGQGIDVTLAPR